MIALIELYPSISLSVAWNLFQGHSSIKQLKLKVVFLGNFLSNPVQTVYGWTGTRTCIFLDVAVGGIFEIVLDDKIYQTLHGHTSFDPFRAVFKVVGEF